MLGVFTIEGFFAGSQLYQDLESCCVENRLQQSKGGGGYCTSPGERGVWLSLGWDQEAAPPHSQNNMLFH